jgi:hypothetical protein
VHNGQKGTTCQYCSFLMKDNSAVYSTDILGEHLM